MTIEMFDHNNMEDYVMSVAKLESLCFADAWTEESCRDSLRLDYNYGLVAMEAGEALGYLLYNVIQDESELLRVAVLDSCRGNGFGEKLTRQYLDSISKSCVKSMLEVRSKNEPAKSLYEKLGYKKLTSRKGYYNNPVDDGDIYQLEF